MWRPRTLCVVMKETNILFLCIWLQQRQSWKFNACAEPTSVSTLHSQRTFRVDGVDLNDHTSSTGFKHYPPLFYGRPAACCPLRWQGIAKEYIYWSVCEGAHRSELKPKQQPTCARDNECEIFIADILIAAGESFLSGSEGLP